MSQVRFKIFGQDEFTTQSVEDTINPSYNFEQVVSWSNVTGDFLRFLKNEALEFEIWGLQEQKAAGEKASVKRFVDNSEVEKLKVFNQVSSYFSQSVAISHLFFRKNTRNLYRI
jgi:hypothetical protein